MKMKINILFVFLLIFLLFTTSLSADDTDYADYADYLESEEEKEEEKEVLTEKEEEKEVLTEKEEEEEELLEEEPETTAETEVAKEIPKEKKEEKEESPPVAKKYVSAAVLANLTVPTGKADATWAVHARLHYILPFWNPHLSFGVEAGYYSLKGKGTNLDPQAGLYDYSWRVDTMPLFIGFNVEYPVISPIFHLFAEAGFAAVFAWSEGSSFGGKSSAKDVAYGWYGGIGAEIRFGVFGGIVLQGRYTGMLLDFDFPQYNESPGDLGGISILLGYRNRF